MNLGFVAAFGWSVLGLVAYAALMLVGAAWSYAIREGSEEALIPLIILHAAVFLCVLFGLAFEASW